MEMIMPGEQGFISALEANVVNLALAAVVVSLIAVILMVLLFVFVTRSNASTLRASLDHSNRVTDNSNRLMDALAAQGNQQAAQGQMINRHSEQMESMIRVMETGQRDQSGETRALRQAVDSHDGNNETRSQALMNRLDTFAGEITNLIGDTGKKVTEGTASVKETLRQLLDSVFEVKASVEESRTQARIQQEEARNQARIQQEEQAARQQAALDAIDIKLGLVSEQVIDVIQAIAIGEDNREDTTHVDSGNADREPAAAGSASVRAGGVSDGSGRIADGLDVGRDAVPDAGDSDPDRGHPVSGPGTGEGGKQTGDRPAEGL
jgi:hypothetical protein